MTTRNDLFADFADDADGLDRSDPLAVQQLPRRRNALTSAAIAGRLVAMSAARTLLLLM